MERNIKLTLSYDGTDFNGWQRQDGSDTRTVQGMIESALEKIHKKPVVIHGSGRTDSGVHAAAQAANFHTDIDSMETWRFIPALNSLLPWEIRIHEACEVLPDFHARFNARSRTYRYYFIMRKHIMPWELRYAQHIKRHPDISVLNSYARLLHGEMDCTAFAVPGDSSKSRHRFIFGAVFFTEGEKLVFEISANAFLWKMVRSIAGTLLSYEEKGFDPSYMEDVLKEGKRSLTGPTAPPEGLFLWKVDFDHA